MPSDLSPQRRRFLRWVGSALALPLAGCSLFPKGVAYRPTGSNGEEGESRGLPGLRKSQESVQIEILFAERALDDPLLGEKGIWQEVDQVGAVTSSKRTSLLASGFRIGHVSSTPPRALEALLGMSSRPAKSKNEGEKNQLVGRKVSLRSGGETEIQASPIYPRLKVLSPAGEGSAETEYENARCMFRVVAHRKQDGWAQLEFLPEIHHGQHVWRRVPTEGGWTGLTTQRILPFFGQRFQVTLNVGEMIVVSAPGPEAPSPGKQFFIGNEETEFVHRVLVVRLAEMGKLSSLYDT